MRWQTGQWLTFGYGDRCPVNDPEYQACLTELRALDWPYQTDERNGLGRIWIEPREACSILEHPAPMYSRTPEGTIVKRRAQEGDA